MKQKKDTNFYIYQGLITNENLISKENKAIHWVILNYLGLTQVFTAWANTKKLFEDYMAGLEMFSSNKSKKEAILISAAVQ